MEVYIDKRISMDIIYLHNDKITGIIWIWSGPHFAVCHWHDGSDWGNLQVAFFQIVFFCCTLHADYPLVI